MKLTIRYSIASSANEEKIHTVNRVYVMEQEHDHGRSEHHHVSQGDIAI